MASGEIWMEQTSIRPRRFWGSDPPVRTPSFPLDSGPLDASLPFWDGSGFRCNPLRDERSPALANHADATGTRKANGIGLILRTILPVSCVRAACGLALRMTQALMTTGSYSQSRTTCAARTGKALLPAFSADDSEIVPPSGTGVSWHIS